jgi:hypothetical protein
MMVFLSYADSPKGLLLGLLPIFISNYVVTERKIATP